MSNRTLAYILIAMVLALAAGFGIWRWQENGKVQPAAVEQDQTASQNNDSSETAKNNPTPPMTTSTPSSQEQNQATCQRNFDENKLKTAKVAIQNRQVEIDVKDYGKITVELYDKDAPKTVENFLRLANAGYYNCITFHRVAKGFVIQGGDPTGTGRGGDSAFGGTFADELNPDTPSYKAGYVKGVLAMANAGPNTNTSQFFIMLGNVPLSHDYTIFGKVVSGMSAVDKIGQAEIVPDLRMNPDGTDGAPKTPVVMQSVKIIK